MATTYDIEAVSGDSLTFRTNLTDAETGNAISNSSVSNVWVRVGNTDYTLANTEISAVSNAIQVALTGEDTQNLTGNVTVHIKVGLNDGREATITNGSGRLIKFSTTPLSENHT